MINIEDVKIRVMQLSDLETAVEMAAQEGWNPGLHDAECFYRVDPEGFICAELAGQIVGCISAVCYDDSFAFAGYFLVKPEFRGQGIGGRLIEAASRHIAPRCCGNDGVVAQQDNYKQLGFATAHRNVRYEGMGEAASSPHPALAELNRLTMQQISDYDYLHFKARREGFLAAWIAQAGSEALGFMEEGRLQGYGVIRQCRRGYKIGPLFAARPDIAEALYAGLADHAAGSPVILDIPEPNTDALLLVQRHGMKAVFETARMYMGPDPGLPLGCIYGITSFELG